MGAGANMPEVSGLSGVARQMAPTCAVNPQAWQGGALGKHKAHDTRGHDERASVTTEKVTALGLGLWKEALWENLPSRSHSLCDEETWLI